MAQLTQRCTSTHGASGYAPGSHWDRGAIVCGYCGERITNPRPTGLRAVHYTFREALFNWAAFTAWLRGTPKGWVPTWPDWIR